jgi:hypothetical protein
MLIGQQPTTPWLERLLPRGRRAYRLAAAAAVGWTVVVACAVAWVDPRGIVWERAKDLGYVQSHGGRVRELVVGTPVSWWRSLGKNVPSLTLDIAFEHVQRLRAQREAALARGVILDSERNEVPMRIRVDGRSVRASVRLKGDLIDQISNGKWSFRVQVKGDDHVFGMRQFSLHHPRARLYHREPLFLETVRREGILGPRYFFVDVTMNGEFIGRMALEEHFSKELLESQARRESVILRFDESLYWAWFMYELSLPFDARKVFSFYDVFDSYTNATVEPFRPATVVASEQLGADLRVATGLLRSFQLGELPASAVFDPDLMGRFIAVAETWGAWHALFWNNLRFYYNPITARLEPVAFDANGLDFPITARQLVNSRGRITQAWLSDPAIDAAYARALRRLSDKLVPGGALARHLDSVQVEYLKALNRYYPLARPIDIQAVAARARELLRIHEGEFDPRPTDERSSVHAYMIEGPEGPYLELASKLPIPIEVTDLYWSRTGVERVRALQLRGADRLGLPIYLPATPPGATPQPLQLPYRRPEAAESLAVVVTAHWHGREHAVAVRARSYYPPQPKGPVPSVTLREALARHAFLRRSPGDSVVHAARGRWRVDRPLTLPPGVGLTMTAGTTLQFAPNAGLVVRGPVTFMGTASAPVVLEGLPSGGSAGGWQGVVVLGNGAPVSWSHVLVRGTTGIDMDGWVLTGGVTFYESDIRVDSSTIVGNRAEDALNIVRSRFRLNEVQVIGAVSDGLDADFSDGAVTGGRFAEIGAHGGGDGIDISGGTVTINGTRFTAIGDKALSVGEGSHVSASNIRVEDATVGAASKEGSVLTLSDASLRAIRHAGLMAYVKKPEFGVARLDATNVRMEHVADAARAQTGSAITIDGRRIASEPLNVDSLYATVMRKGTP